MSTSMSTSDSRISVLIAEDDALLRHFLKHTFVGQESFVVVGAAAGGGEALALATEKQPMVLLLDLGLPDVPGLEVIERLALIDRPPAVLVLTGEETEEVQLAAIRRGARGFLCKSRAATSLLDAVRAVASGDAYFSPRVVGRIVDDYPALIRRVAQHDGPLSCLTERERDVLARVGRGMTNPQIAEELFLSLSSVKVHIRSVFKKLDIPNRAGAAVFAAREGLL
jgi:DNA-binding NarL/FixJ family response regulator